MKLEDKLKFLFLSKILEELESQEPESLDGIFVTDLVYDCLRYVWFRKKLFGLGKALSENEILTLWVGKKLHETPLSSNHEVSLEAFGVRGRIDEIVEIDGEKVIVEKKTTKNLPSKPYPHHIKQVEYYSVLWFEVKKEVISKGAVIYICLNEKTKKLKPFVFSLRPLSVVKQEMLEKVRKLSKALEETEPPAPQPNWYCEFCEYFEFCIKYGFKDKGRQWLLLREVVESE